MSSAADALRRWNAPNGKEFPSIHKISDESLELAYCLCRTRRDEIKPLEKVVETLVPLFLDLRKHIGGECHDESLAPKLAAVCNEVLELMMILSIKFIQYPCILDILEEGTRASQSENIRIFLTNAATRTIMAARQFTKEHKERLQKETRVTDENTNTEMSDKRDSDQLAANRIAKGDDDKQAKLLAEHLKECVWTYPVGNESLTSFLIRGAPAVTKELNRSNYTEQVNRTAFRIYIKELVKPGQDNKMFSLINQEWEKKNIGRIMEEEIEEAFWHALQEKYDPKETDALLNYPLSLPGLTIYQTQEHEIENFITEVMNRNTQELANEHRKLILMKGGLRMTVSDAFAEELTNPRLSLTSPKKATPEQIAEKLRIAFRKCSTNNTWQLTDIAKSRRKALRADIATQLREAQSYEMTIDMSVRENREIQTQTAGRTKRENHSSRHGKGYTSASSQSASPNQERNRNIDAEQKQGYIPERKPEYKPGQRPENRYKGEKPKKER